MSIFSAFAESIEERELREQQARAAARTSITNLASLADLWKFRTGHDQEVYQRAIATAAEARLKARLEERVARALRFADAYNHILKTVIEPSSGKPLYGALAADAPADWYIRGLLTDAAKFDFFGVNFEQEFDLLEFVLTHENPLYIYEVVDHILGMFASVLDGKTAEVKQERFREVTMNEAPEFMRMVFDAYLLHMAERKAVLDKTEHGHTIDFPQEEPAAAAPAEPGHTEAPAAPDEPSVIITDPNASIHVDAAPVEAAQHKAE